MQNWHSLEIKDVFAKLATSEIGLSEKEASKRLEIYGLNKLVEGKKLNPIILFLNQFNNFLVMILILAGIVSWIFADELDAIAIFAIVVLNGVLGFIQEFKAEKAMEALKKMAALKSTVIRNGRIELIDAENLVPGDIVVLESGTKVPADLRLIETVNLKADEAALTGESNPVSKNIETVSEDKELAERKDLCFANTNITYGRGKGIVVETGMKTEFGKIAERIQEIESEDTPLKHKLDILAKQMGIGIIVIIIVLFLIGINEGRELLDMFIISVSLGVAAIPEGLPAVITITLALGIQAMAKKNAIVRKMPAVEALGSATVICSDKTGTITRNEMVVEKIYSNGKLIEVTGNGYESVGKFLQNGKEIQLDNETKKLIEIGFHCNDAEIEIEEEKYIVIGDPTEGSLVSLGQKSGLREKLPRTNELPFDSTRKMMTTCHTVKGKTVAYTKGALEVIIENSKFIQENGEVKELTEEKKKELIEKSESLANDAYRVLGFAYKESETELETEMVFVGIAGLRDPPRKTTEEAIRICETAGIDIKIITGDNALTAAAIGKQIGLKNYEAITGKELDELSEQEFEKVVQDMTIFARVSPEHKYRIVSKLKELGEIVAVTGDGVNDAPALKKADIGIAMGIKGTDVAKEASDIVLADDRFGTIVTAIKEGRRIYDNIRAFIKYLLAANIGEILVVSVATLANWPLPLLALQILWMNLATDALPALALGTEQPEKEIMSKPPRNPKEKILKPLYSFIFIAGFIGMIVTLAAFFYGMQFDLANGFDLGNLDQPSKARTMAFTTLIFFELALVFNCRREDKTMFEAHPLENKYLILAVAVSVILQVMAVHLEFFQTFFKTIELEITDWLIIVLLSLASILVVYLSRFFRKMTFSST